MLYWTGDGPRTDAQAAAALGWKDPVPTAYVEKWASVVQEYGERYREKVAGWWVDGSYAFIGYEVDLLEPHPVRRVKVTFAADGYATKLRISLSADGTTWQTVASADNLDGTPYAGEFTESVRAQFVRVSALKPDGPEQKGAQMAVAELEVYE